MANLVSASPPYFTARRKSPVQPMFDWTALTNGSRAHPAWSPAEAFFALLFIAATCDNELRPAEQEALALILHRSRTLKTLSEHDLATLNATVLGKLEGDPEAALQHICEALPPDLRLPAFAHALDIMLADGELAQAEAAALNVMVAHLRLAADDVDRVAAVLAMKNRA